MIKFLKDHVSFKILKNIFLVPTIIPRCKRIKTEHKKISILGVKVIFVGATYLELTFAWLMLSMTIKLRIWW